jgi:trans-aconitate methyltransferase
MLLNRVEKLMMNNPLRAAVQPRFEARRLLDMGGPATGGRCLELGCGRGVGTQIVLDRFGAGEVDAFDLDPDMVEQARARLMDDRFDAAGFARGLEDQGFRLVARRELFGQFGWFVADKPS